VDAVCFEVPCETGVVACPLVAVGGMCMAFSMLDFSTCFGGMVVHLAVCAFLHLASISSSTSASILATAIISAKGV
jgi:hypothetical protein